MFVLKNDSTYFGKKKSEVSFLHFLEPLAVQSRSLRNLQSSRVLHTLEHPYSATEDPKILPRFSEDKSMEEIASLLGRLHRRPEFTNYDSEFHNHSFDQHDEHHHGDPITGHVATVTLNPRRGSRRSPHADDM